jgi:protein-L-isoaspartate(D-aspartate) O-methyltransferase
MGNRFSQLRQSMVDCQVRTTDVTDLDVIEALLTVPREAFMPAAKRDFAYIDDDIMVTAEPVARYIMEPSPFARLVQLASIEPDNLVLDIGCTTGYSSAVLSRLAGGVIALEEDEELAAQATQILADQTYDSVAVVTGPLNAGHAKEGPYDVIFVGGAVDVLPDALLDQIKPGGRLVVVEGQGLDGRARLYVRDDEGVLGARTAFNLAVKPLPGFQKVAAFEF